MKFKAIIWKYHKLKDGTHPIKIRIRSGDKATYFPLDFYVKPSEFDSKTGRVKDGHKNAQSINLRILKTLQDIEKKHIEDPEMEAQELMAKGPGSDSFYFYYDKRLEFIKDKFGFQNYKKNRAILDKMKAFAPDLKLKQFTWSFLKDFESYLLKKGNHINTIVDNMGRIKTVVFEIIAEGKLLYHENPFLQYKISEEDIYRERLSIEEIRDLEGLEITKDSLDYNIRNYFLFSFYCGGIRFGDFCRLEKTNIRDGRIFYFMKKRARTNKKERRIILLKPSLDILNQYKSTAGKYLFPLLRFKYKDEIEMQRHISSLNAQCNIVLKRIAKKAQIKKDISFHTSRHSVADYAIEKGIDIRDLQEMLGHSKITTTEVYKKNFFPEQTEKAMRKLFEN